MLPTPENILSFLRQTMAGRVYVTHLKKYPFARAAVAWLWRNLVPFYISGIIKFHRIYIAKRRSLADDDPCGFDPAQTAFGKFYNKHLGKYAFAKAAALWAGRSFSSAETFIRLCKQETSLPLITFSGYVEKSDIERKKIAGAEKVNTPFPSFFPKEKRDVMLPFKENYVFPPIFYVAFPNATAQVGIGFAKTGDAVICHDLFDIEHDYTAEELHGRLAIDVKKRRISWAFEEIEPIRVPSAAAFFDPVASNYAHWITEVLPRICLFCGIEEFKETPIFVPDNLHGNILDSLEKVAGSGRRIVKLPLGASVRADKLVALSPAGYVPFERRAGRKNGHSQGMFSPFAFRELIRRLDVDSLREHAPDLPRKVFIKRNSGIRNVTNSAELEAMLVSFGFAVIEPEKMSFIEQVRLFANADVVVGTSGAALANMVFCKPEAIVVIMIAECEGTSYWYWQNMACAAGVAARYVLGRAAGKVPKRFAIHDDFCVDVGDVVCAIREKSGNPVHAD